MTNSYIYSAAANRGARLFLALFAAIHFSVAASGALLDPGATVPLSAAHEPESACLIAVTNFQFTATLFTGTLTSKVWAGDDSNPWGGLTFGYRLVNTRRDSAALGSFTLGGFADALADVNYTAAGVVPCTASRSASGAAITFEFLNHAGRETLRPGSASVWLIIQTDQTTWGVNQFVGLGAAELTAATFTPVAVPEPAVGTLVIFATALGWCGARRREVRAGYGI